MDELPGKPPKTLTVSEANALLPEVRRLVQQLQHLQGSIVQTGQQIVEASKKVAAGNGYPVQSLKAHIQEMTTRQLALIEAFQSVLKQLEGVHALVKDVNAGLIDFYSLRNHELVFLCWKFGEGPIQFWHTLEGGFASRQLLDS